MKTSIALFAVVLLANSTFADPYVIAKQRARQTAEQNNAEQGRIQKATAATEPAPARHALLRDAAYGETLPGERVSWHTAYADWSGIPLPGAPPSRPATLRDWLQFEGIVLPTRDAAHRFTIFLPQSTLGISDRECRR